MAFSLISDCVSMGTLQVLCTEEKGIFLRMINKIYEIFSTNEAMPIEIIKYNEKIS